MVPYILMTDTRDSIRKWYIEWGLYRITIHNFTEIAERLFGQSQPLRSVSRTFRRLEEFDRFYHQFVGATGVVRQGRRSEAHQQEHYEEAFQHSGDIFHRC